ncbi:hypothetical protein [Sporosarcina sp. E16_8]|nr:hypothetical protein [Sporosarcina sp. E16_8]
METSTLVGHFEDFVGHLAELVGKLGAFVGHSRELVGKLPVGWTL